MFHALNAAIFLTVTDYGAFWLFPVLTITNKTAVNKHVHVFVWIYPLISLGCMPRGVIIGSYGKCVFSFLKLMEKCFQSDCTTLNFLQECIRDSVLPHPY